MSQSLTESLGLPVIDWETEIKKLVEEFDERKYYDLSDAANFWTDCPCGQLSLNIERDVWNQPKDTILQARGHNFYSQITAKNFKGALETLKEIKERGEQILNNILNQDGE
jgi:hypothetical protein